MNKVTSVDGTTIAFDRAGSGPAIVFVVGAFNDRSTCAPLADALASDHTVITYDRRGRGDSGDTRPYAIEREIEDLDALIAEAGESAAVFGYSSGAILALRAAERGSAITRLALYEPPADLDGRAARPAGIVDRLAALVAEGRRGDAVQLFQRELIGMPEQVLAQIRQAPFFGALEEFAQSVVYDATIVVEGVTRAGLSNVDTATLVISGSASFLDLPEAARVVAEALPNGRHHSLDGQTHDIVTEVVAPVVRGFLAE
ncbi:pimeloyl-ACP methyl ester carboxylesterase [Herbihabitans rhizosphaerae]|uniref:Pimeloyl-ACP methyl ester carboxylesterase n=1 Tax=Herbihabitans rhizosphaerae TaxID=1872711 RepID=A0A4Q7KKN7_9PSEU|nr:alpha/beta hydrolase [Herbihabitans rhizosphaerae]RZS37149.1 pimeloyl-ACP methyl ester carboxylesterase [Herbihabitans rhizosphaerae]